MFWIDSGFSITLNKQNTSAHLRVLCGESYFFMPHILPLKSLHVRITPWMFPIYLMV